MVTTAVATATVAFTETERRWLQHAAWMIFEKQAPAMLQALATKKRKHIRTVRVPREAAIDAALTPGAIELLIRKARPSLMERWKDLTGEQRQRLIRPAFIAANYGL